MKNKEVWGKIISAAAAILLWQVLSLILGQPLLFASPVSVTKRLFSLLASGEFYAAVLYSFWRIALGFLLGTAAGFLLGLAAGKSKAVETVLFPYMLTVKTVPVASFIVIALIWVKTAVLSVLISFLIVMPVIYNNTLSGFRAADNKLLDMAALFSLSGGKKFLYIRMSAIKPFLLSACRSAIGLAFKSGIAAEVIGLPHGSLGERLYDAKVYFDSTSLFAYTVIIVLLSLLFEWLFCTGLKFLFEKAEKKL